MTQGDRWEPLLEEGQVEAEMSKEQLRIVESDPESRCSDARRCRLSAFGAALRNRCYDEEEGDNREPLERALRAIFSTPSLTGPLKRTEIEFYVTWLVLAYRSKSPLLGFGDDKIPVATDGFCMHIEDGSPKYELGSRPLPGKTMPLKGVFEPEVTEVDDFLKDPVSLTPVRKKKPGKKKSRSNSEEDEAGADSKESEDGTDDPGCDPGTKNEQRNEEMNKGSSSQSLEEKPKKEMKTDSSKKKRRRKKAITVDNSTPSSDEEFEILLGDP